jgi:hypothetical protein
MAERLKVGDMARVNQDAPTVFAGRIGTVTYGPDRSGGYYLSIGAADRLWFFADELAYAGVQKGDTEMNALNEDRVTAALVRVADLWPEGLDAVPGSNEVYLKRDADTIRALAQFWRHVRTAGDFGVQDDE